MPLWAQGQYDARQRGHPSDQPFCSMGGDGLRKSAVVGYKAVFEQLAGARGVPRSGPYRDPGLGPMCKTTSDCLLVDLVATMEWGWRRRGRGGGLAGPYVERLEVARFGARSGRRRAGGTSAAGAGLWLPRAGNEWQEPGALTRNGAQQRLLGWLIGVAWAGWAVMPSGWAQEPDSGDPGTANVEQVQGDLAEQQRQVAEQFRHLEEVLARMAELSGVAAPERAALLKRAVAMSKERLIGVQLESIAELLEKESLARAVENQETVHRELEQLLELLLSENRSRRIESEKARIRRYLKELNRLIKQQKSIEGRTAGGGDSQRLADEQGQLARQTGSLAREIRANEESPSEGRASGDSPRDPGGQQAEGPSGGKPGEGERGEEKSPKGSGGAEQSPRSGETPRGQSQRGEGSEGSPAAAPKSSGGSQGARGGQGQGESGGGPQGQEAEEGQQAPRQQQGDEQAHPARQRLEAARRRMREAQQRLNKAQRDGAVEKQEEAVRELEEAKAELERILRQLREEEIARVLRALEQRFLKMLDMQREVYEGTKRLDAVPADQRDRNHQIEASRLSRREAEIVLEADQAWNLLREDGTAVAFPVAVQQVREDMEQVVQRLAQDRVGLITQGIEEDIIAALEEMIKALQQAIRDAEDRRQPMPDMPIQPQDPPLVDVLAELKMIRALQMRVNRRTQRYSKLIQGQQADHPELLEALDRLADRQAEIFRITRDLQLGKNR